MQAILKYPRTPHLRGSALQNGDEPDRISMSELRDRGEVVWEEKVDGGNCGISFSPDDGRLILQSRGHSLEGGPREKQFTVLKQWARVFEKDLRDVLGLEYVLYSESMLAKHTIWYDRLESYVLSYDCYSRSSNRWLSTAARARLFGDLVTPVRVVHTGWVADCDVPKLVKESAYRSPQWKESLRGAVEAAGEDFETVLGQTDPSPLAEGVYMKLEDDHHTLMRAKFVRPGFVQAILDSGAVHWAKRPMIKNQLAPGIDMFARPSMTSGVAP
ncbi:hypothetical protein ACVIGB_000141 [Bradyrhizobium sp. USDA 4341]